MAQQPDPQALAASLAAYQAQTQALRASLTSYITRLWAVLGSYRAADMKTFVGQIVPVVAGAQRQIAALTAASLAAQKQASLGGSFAPAAVNPAKVTGAAVRNGTDPAEVYGRPFHLVWRQLAELPHEDGAIDQAIQSGLDRAVQSALTDVQLAKTHTAQQVLSQDKQVVGYRRILEGAYSCGLCVIASTQRYHRGDLLPIHPACDCACAPIYGESDPGQTIDLDAYFAAHQAAKDVFGKSNSRATDYNRLLITHAHGELGPVLAVRGQPYLGPSDLAA